MTGRLVWAVVAVSAVFVAACGDGAPAVSSSSSGPYQAWASSSGSSPADAARSAPGTTFGDLTRLPPLSAEALGAKYSPIVEPLGVRLTRAAVVMIDTGPHLQLYVEPSGTAVAAQDYLERLVPLAKEIAPDAFGEYDALETFDICQEPAPGVDDRLEPDPVSVVFLTRAQVGKVAWDRVTLKDLRQVVKDVPGGQIEVHMGIDSLPGWKSSEPS